MYRFEGCQYNDEDILEKVMDDKFDTYEEARSHVDYDKFPHYTITGFGYSGDVMVIEEDQFESNDSIKEDTLDMMFPNREDDYDDN